MFHRVLPVFALTDTTVGAASYHTAVLHQLPSRASCGDVASDDLPHEVQNLENRLFVFIVISWTVIFDSG